MTHTAYDFTAVFPEEINEIVWDYLPTKDLLNATLTSKLWNDVIGKSATFKKRIVINVSDLEKDKPIIKLNRSNRSYETINIRRVRKPSDLSHLGEQEWKKVFFNVAKLKTQKKFVEVMIENFPLVKDLKIMNVSIKELSKNATISLPNLEHLVFSDISLDVFDIFINTHPKLKSLSMRFVYKDLGHESTVGGQLEKFLNLNKKVQHLEIYEDITNDFFTQDISQRTKLNLKSLAIGMSNTSDDVRENLVKFLKSEGDTLYDLRIVFCQRNERQEGHHWGYWAQEEENTRESADDLMVLVNSWNHLKTLEKLTLRFLKSSDAFEIDRNILKTLQPNSNIKEISIKHINCELPIDAIQNILKYAPSIQSLYISKLTLRIFRFLALNFSLLRDVKYSIEEGDCKKEYGEMIAANKCDNKFIKLSQEYLG